MFFMALWASLMVVFTAVMKLYWACMSATEASARGSGIRLKSWVAMVWSPTLIETLYAPGTAFGPSRLAHHIIIPGSSSEPVPLVSHTKLLAPAVRVSLSLRSLALLLKLASRSPAALW